MLCLALLCFAFLLSFSILLCPYCKLQPSFSSYTHQVCPLNSVWVSKSGRLEISQGFLIELPACLGSPPFPFRPLHALHTSWKNKANVPGMDGDRFCLLLYPSRFKCLFVNGSEHQHRERFKYASTSICIHKHTWGRVAEGDKRKGEGSADGLTWSAGTPPRNLHEPEMSSCP